jgi:hypothetical protein
LHQFHRRKVQSRLARRWHIVLPFTATCLDSVMAGEQTILVEPNILASRESALPKNKMIVIADPEKTKYLLGTAIGSTLVEEICELYVSFGGGYTWTAVVPPDLPETGARNPQIVFDNHGTSHLKTLGVVPDQAKRLHFAASLYRSRDGGLSWEKIATFEMNLT